MRVPVFILLGLVLISLQTSVFHLMPEWIGMPDLLFLLILFSAIYMRILQGAILCLVLGTGMEVFSGYFMGLYSISYLMTFFIIRGVSAALAINDSSQQPAIAGLAYLLASVMTYSFTSMLSKESLELWSWTEVLRRDFIIIILTLPSNAVFRFILEKCDKKYERKSFFKKKKRFSGNRYRPQKR